MNRIYMIRLVLPKRPGFQSQKYGMPSYTYFKNLYIHSNVTVDTFREQVTLSYHISFLSGNKNMKGQHYHLNRNTESFAEHCVCVA